MTVTTRHPATTPQRWESFRLLLEEQRAECVRRRETALAEAATPVPDPVATSRAAGLALTLEEIDAALHRIADGTYGRCRGCGVEIPGERLEFRPYASGCVTCQSSAS